MVLYKCQEERQRQTSTKERRKKMKKFYRVTSGDWFRGGHADFQTLEEAEKEYSIIEKTAVWGVLTEINKGFFRKWEEKEIKWFNINTEEE